METEVKRKRTEKERRREGIEKERGLARQESCWLGKLPTRHSSVFVLFFIFRSLPKLTAHEDEGVHQNPQYTGQHHFHPVVHDHDCCQRVVINVSTNTLLWWFLGARGKSWPLLRWIHIASPTAVKTCFEDQGKKKLLIQVVLLRKREEWLCWQKADRKKKIKEWLFFFTCSFCLWQGSIVAFSREPELHFYFVAVPPSGSLAQSLCASLDPSPFVRPFSFLEGRAWAISRRFLFLPFRSLGSGFVCSSVWNSKRCTINFEGKCNFGPNSWSFEGQVASAPLA